MATHTITGAATATVATYGEVQHGHLILGATSANCATTGRIGVRRTVSGVVTATASTSGRITRNGRIAGTASVNAATSGVVRYRRRIIGASQANASTSGRIRPDAYRIKGSVVAFTYTSGTLRVIRQSLSLPEDRRAVLGRRPSTSLLVYATDARVINDTVSCPDLGSFLVSPQITPDDGLWARGARPNFVGTKNGANFVFRPPLDFDIVWHILRDSQGRVKDGDFFRFNGTVWRPFYPYPLRSLLSQLSFVIEQADPGGAIRYYAKLLSAISSQLGQDNIDIASVIDPDATPDRYLPVLADTIGLNLTDVTEAAEKRRRIKNAIPLIRLKGTERACVTTIRELGYTGYVQEIWVRNDDPAVWYGQIDCPPAPRAYLESRGLFRELKVESGRKGSGYIERPHQYDNVNPTVYFPSSRVAVHVNNADGSPLSIYPSNFPTLARRLRFYALPAHVDIRYLVTDFYAGSCSVTPDDEVVFPPTLDAFNTGQETSGTSPVAGLPLDSHWDYSLDLSTWEPAFLTTDGRWVNVVNIGTPRTRYITTVDLPTPDSRSTGAIIYEYYRTTVVVGTGVNLSQGIRFRFSVDNFISSITVNGTETVTGEIGGFTALTFFTITGSMGLQYGPNVIIFKVQDFGTVHGFALEWKPVVWDTTYPERVLLEAGYGGAGYSEFVFKQDSRTPTNIYGEQTTLLYAGDPTVGPFIYRLANNQWRAGLFLNGIYRVSDISIATTGVMGTVVNELAGEETITFTITEST